MIVCVDGVSCHSAVGLLSNGFDGDEIEVVLDSAVMLGCIIAGIQGGSYFQRHIIIIIMVIFKCYFSREHIALSYIKWCEHRIRKNQQIKGTAFDGKSYLNKQTVSIDQDKA